MGRGNFGGEVLPRFHCLLNLRRELPNLFFGQFATCGDSSQLVLQFVDSRLVFRKRRGRALALGFARFPSAPQFVERFGYFRQLRLLGLQELLGLFN